MRKVDRLGRISWRDRPVYVSKALRAEYVALEELDDGIWVLVFRHCRLALFDERRMKISS